MEARCGRGGASSRVGEVAEPNEVVMEAMVCCTCVQEAWSPRMTQGEQGYFLSHRVLRLRHCKQLRFLTLLLALASAAAAAALAEVLAEDCVDDEAAGGREVSCGEMVALVVAVGSRDCIANQLGAWSGV